MIDLQQYKKQQNYNDSNQLVLMDFSEKIMQSCNSLFDTSIFKAQSIVKEIPFLESIFHVIKAHVVGTPAILFKKVESPFYLLDGIYDFTFSKLIFDNQPFILWTIFDKTAQYNDLIKSQQVRNELEIQRQLKNSRLLVIHERKKVLQNIFSLLIKNNLSQI